ncbi:MAG TPA: efflux RND transporter periplasmic adaptor subunit [Oscillatoriaceae cyanobacterium M33_DOE_052]|uniref:Efflux RND transporter periplasmic adaptor subunit n=1 Tax=Planktothricoides sp. SpSt-374 TaxID=2282167 RepID=A0A7C3ZYC4_9CYAN|nr:efflux RND transporter periplasmic adaptor subunit [Oscillatoriaceae cyanobacterium M33_DOE_052]
MDKPKSSYFLEEEKPDLSSPDETVEPIEESPLEMPEVEKPNRQGTLRLQSFGKYKSAVGALVGALALAGLAVWGWQLWFKPTEEASAKGAGAGKVRALPVQLTTVQVSALAESSEFVGYLEAPKSTEIRPEMEGRLTAIYVQPGDRVRQGQTIARIDPEDVRAQLSGAQAALAASVARLNQLETGTRSEEIERARSRLEQSQARLAELLAGSQAEEIKIARSRLERAQLSLDVLRSGSRQQLVAQAEARVTQAQARLDLVEERLRRNRMLAEEGAISRDRLDEVETEARTTRANLEEANESLAQLEKSSREEIRTAEAEVEEARLALTLVERGPRPEEIARAEAEVEERRQELRQMENGTRPEEIDRARAEVAEARARVQATEVQLNQMEVLAPFSGTIGDVPSKLGDFVTKGQTITTLTENDYLEMRLWIPTERVPQLRLGLPVEIRDSGGKALSEGKVTFISPSASTESQNVLAKATFENQRSELINGMFVRAKVIWRQRSSIMVPATAIIYEGEQRFIYLAQPATGENATETPGLQAKKQPVKLGVVEGDRVEIIDGLTTGDKIVISGLQKIRPNAPLSPVEKEPPNSKESAPPSQTDKT